MARMFGKNPQKCGAQCERCSLKFAVKFKQKCWWNRTASFAPFTWCSCPCALHSLFGEIDSWIRFLLNPIHNSLMMQSHLGLLKRFLERQGLLWILELFCRWITSLGSEEMNVGIYWSLLNLFQTSSILLL